MVGLVLAEGIWNISYVLWPASKDCVCEGVQTWVIADSCLELCLLLCVMHTGFMTMSRGISGVSGGA